MKIFELLSALNDAAGQYLKTPNLKSEEKITIQNIRTQIVFLTELQQQISPTDTAQSTDGTENQAAAAQQQVIAAPQQAAAASQAAAANPNPEEKSSPLEKLAEVYFVHAANQLKAHQLFSRFVYHPIIKSVIESNLKFNEFIQRLGVLHKADTEQLNKSVTAYRVNIYVERYFLLKQLMLLDYKDNSPYQMYMQKQIAQLLPKAQVAEPKPALFQPMIDALPNQWAVSSCVDYFAQLSEEKLRDALKSYVQDLGDRLNGIIERNNRALSELHQRSALQTADYQRRDRIQGENKALEGKRRAADYYLVLLDQIKNPDKKLNQLRLLILIILLIKKFPTVKVEQPGGDHWRLKWQVGDVVIGITSHGDPPDICFLKAKLSTYYLGCADPQYILDNFPNTQNAIGRDSAEKVIESLNRELVALFEKHIFFYTNLPQFIKTWQEMHAACRYDLLGLQSPIQASAPALLLPVQDEKAEAVNQQAGAAAAAKEPPPYEDNTPAGKINAIIKGVLDDPNQTPGQLEPLAQLMASLAKQLLEKAIPLVYGPQNEGQPAEQKHHGNPVGLYLPAQQQESVQQPETDKVAVAVAMPVAAPSTDVNDAEPGAPVALNPVPQ